MSTTAPSTHRPCEFGLCDGSGFVIDEQTATARDCRCRALRIAATRARALEARIPKRYRAISFEHSDVIEMQRRFPTQVREIRRFADDINGNLDAGRCLWLTGSFGTGKTALAMIVSKAAIDAGRTVAIYSCPRLLSVIRESIDGGGVLDFLDRLAAADLLHIDDLGAEHRTEWVLEQPTRSSTRAMRTSARRSSPRISSATRWPSSSASGSSPGWRGCAASRCRSGAATRGASPTRSRPPSPARTKGLSR
jgi:hypothetical protein